MLKWLFKANKQPPPKSSPVDAALQHHRAGRLPEAEAAYREVLRIDPENIDALHFLGVIAYQQRRHEQARQLISQALARNATNAPAHNNLGNVLVELGRPEVAVASYQQAIALQPDYLDAHVNLGNLLTNLGRLGEAIASYRRALALDPELPEVHSNLGNALRAVGRPEEAVTCCRAALALKPGFTAALCNLGNALKDQDQLEEAIACYREALALQPDFVEVHYNLGTALASAGRMDEARECFRKALSINPEYAEARWAFVMSQLPAVYEADDDLKRCRDAFSRELEELERWFDFDRASGGFKAVGVLQPFYLAYQEQSNRALLARHGNLCARIMAEWFHRQGFAAFGQRRADGVIHVGIVSRHFRNHSVWNAIVKGWFQKLDRSRFAIDAFHLGSDHDAETLFAQSEASHFDESVGGLRQWVEAIASRRPDVLIYPEIGMDPMTVRLASMRLAPVQIATWGHPETSGLPTMDYYLSAENLEPANAQENYTERLVTLPHLGCYYQPAEFVAADPDLAGLGIDQTAPILLCPGLPPKYSPRHDRVFTEIASRLGRCQFVFFTYPTGDTSDKLRRRLEIVFAQSRLDFGDFVTFIPWQSRAGFYGFLRRSDVLLDTIGFSGFNTAMQAVECSLPVVTREGRFLRGRLASGILERIGLPELVAKSEEEYVGLAIALCRDTEYRERVRKRIEAGRHALFEDAAPIRAMEDFLAEAVKR